MKRRRAFTIMEVLIALAVFAMAAVMLGASYLNVLNSYVVMERASEHEGEIKAARAAVLTEPDREAVEKGAEFSTSDGRQVRWRASIQGTTTADLFDVKFECEITSPQLKQPVRTTEVIRVLRPTWSKVDERDKLRAAARERIVKLQKQP